VVAWIDVQQQSEEWLKMRIGCCTASRVGDIMKRLQRNAASGKKGDYSTKRKAYMTELICEHLTGRAASHYVTPYMETGIDTEPLARARYEVEMDEMVEHGGFALHDSIQYFGASPDARVGDKGLAEFKCLKSENHIEIVQSGYIPDEFFPQMNAELACMPEREWVDFVSFNPHMPKGLQLFVRRHYRDKERILELENEVQAFLTDLGAELGKLTSAVPIVTTLEAVL
jgi:YqaJ-like viral recombinase domain